jgi:predicted MPP superfamily phosphohydrolase
VALLKLNVLTRRRVLQMAAAAAAAAGGVGFHTWRIEPHWLEIVYRTLPIRNLPRRLHGRRLVQLSDIHVGPRVDDDYVLTTFRRVAALQPDIVVLTGDFTTYHPGVFDQASALYRHMPTGRLGTVAILGNHDYGPGWNHPDIAQQIIERVSPFGITLLRNQAQDVDGLQIAGLDDLWADRFSPEPALRALDPSRASLVLTHNPDTVDLPGWGNYQGWILAGHTHGGQCKPPFLPPPLLPVRNRRYTSGEFELSGERRLYINRGVGHLLRVRFNVRPEVTVFELREA